MNIDGFSNLLSLVKENYMVIIVIFTLLLIISKRVESGFGTALHDLPKFLYCIVAIPFNFVLRLIGKDVIPMPFGETKEDQIAGNDAEKPEAVAQKPRIDLRTIGEKIVHSFARKDNK